jgi:transposase InsO family protein
LSICWIIRAIFRIAFANRSSLVAENLALRQQLAVLQRNTKRPKLRNRDRIFWAWLSRLWNGWRSTLLIVQPETVVKWHRQGFKLYWRFKSRKRSGRPKISREIRKLIQRMSQENPTWGVPRIKSELALLGYQVAESTVAKYMYRQKKPPSQTWRTFLLNHATEIAAIDFFTMPSVSYRIFYVFVVLRHSDRKILHFNITQHPSAIWTAQQITEAFPFDSCPRFILRDRDRIYGECFRKRVEHMGINDVLIAPRSPWQNPYVERVIGSIRRECLDHLIVLGEHHLCRILREYVEYYNKVRPHLSLNRNSPLPREVETSEKGKVIAIPYLNGLHHKYARAA